jgi:hypothetical protein
MVANKATIHYGIRTRTYSIFYGKTNNEGMEMIDEIRPPTPPKTVYVAFEMISPELADWLISLDIVTRETMIYDEYVKYTLSKENIR